MIAAFIPPEYLFDGSSLSTTATLITGKKLTVTAIPDPLMVSFKPQTRSALMASAPLAQGASWVVYVVDRIYGF